MLQSEDHLKSIKFPIISDREGDFSRSFGVLKIYNDETGADRFGAARNENGALGLKQ